MNEDFLAEMRGRLDPYFMSHFLFFDKWNEPPDFLKLPKKQRVKLMQTLTGNSVAPTRTNYWVWFGTYATPNNQPRFQDTSVPRALYNALINPVGDKRVMPMLTTCRSDVNPFKYRVCNGMTILDQVKLFKDMTGANPVEIMNAQNNAKFQKMLNETLEAMNELFTPQGIDTREMMKKVLLHNGCVELAIDEAFKFCDKPFIS